MRCKTTPFRAWQAPRPDWLPAAFVAFYVAAAFIAYKWTTAPGGLAIFWLNNGLVAAALLLLPRTRGVAVALAGFLTDMLFAHFVGASPWAQAALIGGFDIVEAWLAAVLVRNAGGAALDLTHVRRFVAVILRGVLPSTLCVGTIGSLLFKFVYGAELESMWPSWALGDFLGMSIGLPATLIIARFGRFDRPKRSSPLTSMGCLLVLVALAATALGAPGPPLAFLLFPLFLIAAFRLTPPYVAAGLVSIALIAACLTIAGRGPFAAEVNVAILILRLQLYLACLVFTVLLLQSSLAERARAKTRVVAALARVSRARARAEAALGELAASEDRFRLLAENASDVIGRSDADGRILYLSPSARSIYGYEPEELIGALYEQIVHPEDLDAIRGHVSDLRQPGAAALPGCVAYRIVTKGGAVRWVEAARWAVFHPDTGSLLEIQGIVRDMTDRKALEAELEARRREAEAASVAKSQFLANMSHEIRTPMNGVIAMADLLARSELDERDRRLVEIIRASGDSLNRLLSDILDLARVEAGHVELEAAPFHLGEAVRSVAALCALNAQEKGIGLAVEVVPEADRHFEGDQVRVRQIVTNLVSNAVKFTAAGEVRVRVWTPARGGVGIEVSDTGVGFDSAVKERLFDRFQQADGSITRRFGGTGLGLAISRHLAEAMGGSLRCDSTPGEGSRFWFEAPLRLASAAETSHADDGQALRPEGGKVLVVDDHPTNRTVAELILADFGFDVDLAENGAEALAAFDAGVYDLILMDMQMPVMDGLTAVRRIRALEAERLLPRTAILMLSANALPEHVVQSQEAGADGHVAKPVTAGGLMSAIVALDEANAAEDEQAVRA